MLIILLGFRVRVSILSRCAPRIRVYKDDSDYGTLDLRCESSNSRIDRWNLNYIHEHISFCRIGTHLPLELFLTSTSISAFFARNRSVERFKVTLRSRNVRDGVLSPRLAIARYQATGRQVTKQSQGKTKNKIKDKQAALPCRNGSALGHDFA